MKTRLRGSTPAYTRRNRWRDICGPAHPRTGSRHRIERERKNFASTPWSCSRMANGRTSTRVSARKPTDRHVRPQEAPRQAQARLCSFWEKTFGKKGVGDALDCSAASRKRGKNQLLRSAKRRSSLVRPKGAEEIRQAKPKKRYSALSETTPLLRSRFGWASCRTCTTAIARPL